MRNSELRSRISARQSDLMRRGANDPKSKTGSIVSDIRFNNRKQIIRQRTDLQSLMIKAQLNLYAFRRIAAGGVSRLSFSAPASVVASLREVSTGHPQLGRRFKRLRLLSSPPETRAPRAGTPLQRSARRRLGAKVRSIAADDAIINFQFSFSTPCAGILLP